MPAIRTPAPPTCLESAPQADSPPTTIPPRRHARRRRHVRLPECRGTADIPDNRLLRRSARPPCTPTAAARTGRSAGRRRAARGASRRGRSGDNAPAEGFFGTLKVKLLYGRDWSREPRGVQGGPRGLRRAVPEGRLKLFVEPNGTRRYETTMGRRRRLGLAV